MPLAVGRPANRSHTPRACKIEMPSSMYDPTRFAPCGPNTDGHDKGTHPSGSGPAGSDLAGAPGRRAGSRRLVRSETCGPAPAHQRRLRLDGAAGALHDRAADRRPGHRHRPPPVRSRVCTCGAEHVGDRRAQSVPRRSSPRPLRGTAPGSRGRRTGHPALAPRSRRRHTPGSADDHASRPDARGGRRRPLVFTPSVGGSRVRHPRRVPTHRTSSSSRSIRFAPRISARTATRARRRRISIASPPAVPSSSAR